MKKILCIDFYNILYRSFYALKDMRNSKGVAIGGFFSFIKTMKKVIKIYSIDIILVVGDSFSTKKEQYESYKANRDIAPIELTAQKQMLFDFFTLVNIPFIAIDGFEADDILVGIVDYLVYKEQANEYAVYILSGDKDLHGTLLTPSTFIINPIKYELYDYRWLKKNYWESMTLDSFYLYYALIGDQSDNIPGVIGIGPKNAEKIVSLYPSYNQLFDAITSNTLSPLLSMKNRMLLLSSMQNLKDSYFLVLPQKCDFSQLENIDLILSEKYEIDNLVKGNDFLDRIECPSLMQKSFGEKQNGAYEKNLVHVKNTFTTKIFTTMDDYIALEALLRDNQYIAIDTETSSGNPQDTILLGFSLCVQPEVSWYVPLYYKKEKNILYDKVVSLLSKYNILSKTWLMHNALFDLHALNRIGINLVGSIFDTMITAYIFKENKIGLKELSSKLLLQKMNSFSEIMEFGTYSTFDEVPIEKSSMYASADAKQTLLLYHYYLNFLNQEKYSNEKNILYQIEFWLIKVLHHMEKSGIICNRNHLMHEEKKYMEKINVLKMEIKSLVQPYGISLNPMSSKQTQHFLYSILNLPHSKSKKTDHVSLSMIAHLHPIVPLIILYRSLFSNISHFTTGLLKYIKADGKIYTHYQQLVTLTGRITTINPNLQNIPRSHEMYKIRNAFCADQGNVLVSFDYSQVELRVLAHFSKDPELVRIFTANEDMHILTAKIIFHKHTVNEVSQTERQIGKKINFSILYGQSAYNLAKDLQVDIKRAKEYLHAFETFYKGIFFWKDIIVKKAILDGYVQTLLGFKRIIPELQDKNKNIFEAGKRMAFNTIIQGTAAEITKKAMIDVYNYVLVHPAIQMKLQIHDELLIQIPCDQADIHMQAIKSIMENTIQLDIPLIVNMHKDICWQ